MELSVLQIKLLDEYYRCEHAYEFHKKNYLENPVRGNITYKTMKGKKRPYLQWTADGVRKEKYLNHYVLPIILRQLEDKASEKKSMEHVSNDMKMLERALGKGLIDEYRGKI